MALQALAHPNRGDNDVGLIWGTNNVRVRLLREIENLGYVCVREFGLKNENPLRGEDSGRAFGALRGTLW
jgi:hypothetical protein